MPVVVGASGKRDMITNKTDDHAYRPPVKSTGVRTFAARSRSSARGFCTLDLPAEDHPRQLISESHGERGTLLLLYAHPDIWNIHDQPARIPYVGLTGKHETHIPDYLAEFRGGERVAIAVKPLSRVRKTNFRATLRAVQKHMSPSFADRLVLVTEQNRHPAELRNAEFLYLCRQHKDRDADLRVAEETARLTGEITISELVQKIGINGRGFRAVFRAIYSGVLIAEKRKVITASSRVSVPGRSL